MYSPSRDAARRFLIEAWRKHRARLPLSGLERMAAAIVALHPEHHGVLEDAERWVDRDWRPEDGSLNPFLHLSLHLAVAEQIAADRPTGVRGEFERIRTARGDEHAALHAMLECLGEVLWTAQRQGTPPDAALYLECLARHEK